MADYSNLKQKAQEVRNETRAGANTADRVGYVLVETVKAIEAEEKRAKEAESKAQETLRLGAGLGWDEGKLAVRYGRGLTSNSQQGLRVDVGSLVSGGRGLNFYGDGTMGVNVGAGLKVASCAVVVDYGTGLKLSGNTLVLDKSVLPDVPNPEDIWSKSIDSTLEFGEGGDTLGVSLANIAGDGLEKSSGSQLQVLLGTEAPVRATCGGLGFTNAGGLALALGNKVFKLGPTGLGISTSDTVTDAGGKLAVRYGKGLTSDSQQGLRVDAENLTVGNAEKLSGTSIRNFMLFSNMEGRVVAADFIDNTLSKVAGEKYIEFWDGTGGWFNSNWGKVTAHGGFIGNLTGTADKATADANGNNITETYARRFMPTNGLEINSDRELFLPNLTASVVNGAVDGSKNGAQRVLELSCGAIQIKLSTGLAIDDKGYLYVQKNM